MKTLTIEKDDVGNIIISRYPFETVFTPQEFQEIREYCKPSEQYCLWIEDDDGVYQTSCLHSFQFMDGTPERNGMKFCPYCGKPIGRQTSHTPQYDGYRRVGEP